MAENILRVAIYARKSKETEKGDSVDNQVTMCKEYIKLHIGSNVDITVYEDEGYSGKNLNRPEFQKMMAIQQIYPYNFIVVYRLDRVSRSVGDFAHLNELLYAAHTALVCIKEQFDTSNPMGRAMMNIAAVFAQLERETIAERVRDNMYLLAKIGHWTGGSTPMGYKSEEHISLEGDKNHKHYTLIIDDTQIATVRVIFDMFEKLRSLNALEKYLNEHHIYTQNGKEWDKTNVKRILTNPVYCIADKESLEYFSQLGCNIAFKLDDCDGKIGIMAYNRTTGEKRTKTPPEEWLITTSSHEGILTGKEWVHIQEVLKENSKEKFGGKANSFVPLNNYALLSGVLYCQRCGAPMRPKKYPSGSITYICSGKASGTRCDCPNLPQEMADQMIAEKLLDKSGKGFTAKYLGAMNKAVKDYDRNRAKRIEALSHEKQQNELQIKNLVNNISTGMVSDITMQAINSQIEQLDKRNKGIVTEISAISSKEIEYAEITQKVKQATIALEQLSKHFNDLSIVNRRDYIKSIIDRIEYDGKDLHIFTKGSAD